MANQLLDKVDSIRRVYEKGDYMKTVILSFNELMEMNGYKGESFVIEVVKEHGADLLAVIASETATHNQKLGARVVLGCAYGEETISRLIENFAVVTDRNDSLVRAWRNKCLERDGRQCVQCNSKESLCVHHVSYWSNDPINRINPDNGITLCGGCHAKAHEGDWFSAFVK